MIRFYGHFEGDAQLYRAEGEVDNIRKNKDCIKMFTEKVTGAGVISDTEIKSIDDQVGQLIDESVAEAIDAPVPTTDKLTTDVYVNY